MSSVRSLLNSGVDVRFWPIPLKNSVLEPECHVIKQLEPRLFDMG